LKLALHAASLFLLGDSYLIFQEMLENEPTKKLKGRLQPLLDAHVLKNNFNYIEAAESLLTFAKKEHSRITEN